MLPTILGSFIIGNCGSLVRGFISWITESTKKTELERQSLSMELELLRSQLNHHFLFNTLNNIDALIFKNPHKASDALIALSSILRYMLYETKTEKVPFDKELENIQHIIHLEQLRIPVESYTRLTIEGTTAMVMVPPLLFVSFVENAYKHSVNMGKLPVIDIHFRHEDEKVHFTCKNSATFSQPASDHPGNLGLENIARRLNLLYGDRCKLNISHTSSEFIVDLEIPC
ncbi:MAG: histidine kinase [Bacteroidales bacterium]|nr:histidine kinase [Bacteroidales bacterium]